MILRDYQQRSIDELYEWFEKHSTGNPCLVLPTGSGKSHIVAALCKGAVQAWPETRVLMLTHVKELIEQNAEKMRQHWPGAPMGIYSAGMRQKDLSEPITFAGIQSVRNRSEEIGHVDLVVIDECHLVSHKLEGGYRLLIMALQEINPHIRVIGLTATPWRLGHGLITDGDGLFDDLLEPVTIEELIYKGHLTTLRSKVTGKKLSAEGVKKRGGEYIEKELQAAVDTDDNNAAVVDEVIQWGADRKSWLFFCTGVNHAENVRDCLRQRGITAETVTGSTPRAERELILERFKAGEIQALTNANVLTTGFDAPTIDLIAMMRPTMSPSLYSQMVGRGFRVAEGKTDCLVLDFAGVVETHGPVTAIRPPKKGGEGGGEIPTKVCDHCHELVFIAARECPNCGAAFPEPQEQKMRLRNDDIMGLTGHDMEVSSWSWGKHTSRTSGKDMLKVTYYGALSDPSVSEYYCIFHAGYAGQKAMREFATIARSAGVHITNVNIADSSGTCTELARIMNESNKPQFIEYRKDGKFHRVLRRAWEHETESA